MVTIAGTVHRGFQVLRDARACRVALSLREEIEEIQALRAALSSTVENPASPVSLLEELILDRMVPSRRRFHEEMTDFLGLRRTDSQDGSSSTHLAWLDTQLKNAKLPTKCDNPFERHFSSRLSRLPEQVRFTEMRKTLAPEWTQNLATSRANAEKLWQDFEHDRQLLCHSRGNLGRSLLIQHFAEQRCTGAAYHCGKYLAKVQSQVRSLASLDHVNETKFIDKWGLDRLHSGLCEKK
jgi:hypothetical protein